MSAAREALTDIHCGQTFTSTHHGMDVINLGRFNGLLGLLVFFQGGMIIQHTTLMIENKT